jgi:hypothetical protein
MTIGLIVGSYFLPQESQTYLSLFKTWALPIVEVVTMTFVVIKVRRAIKTHNQSQGFVPDLFSAIKKVCSEILPKILIVPFATEIAVFYYGFINWKVKVIKGNESTYHKNSRTPSLFGGFTMIISIESVTLHFLLARWSPVAAWILTALSVYTTIQVFGFARSLSKRPISINLESFTLKYGVLNEAEIYFSAITKIEISSTSLEKEKLTKTLSSLGDLESHNIIIYLKKEHELTGLYGIKKKFNLLGMYIDEPMYIKEKWKMHYKNRFKK